MTNPSGLGMTDPTVIPAGSVINLNGRLVRVGGAAPAAAGGSRGDWSGQAGGAAPPMAAGVGGVSDGQMGDAQTIPSGGMVDLGGGKLVQVGSNTAGGNTGGQFGGGGGAEFSAGFILLPEIQ